MNTCENDIVLNVGEGDVVTISLPPMRDYRAEINLYGLVISTEMRASVEFGGVADVVKTVAMKQLFGNKTVCVAQLQNRLGLWPVSILKRSTIHPTASVVGRVQLVKKPAGKRDNSGTGWVLENGRIAK